MYLILKRPKPGPTPLETQPQLTVHARTRADERTAEPHSQQSRNRAVMTKGLAAAQEQAALQMQPLAGALLPYSDGDLLRGPQQTQQTQRTQPTEQAALPLELALESEENYANVRVQQPRRQATEPAQYSEYSQPSQYRAGQSGESVADSFDEIESRETASTNTWDLGSDDAARQSRPLVRPRQTPLEHTEHTPLTQPTAFASNQILLPPATSRAPADPAVPSGARGPRRIAPPKQPKQAPVTRTADPVRAAAPAEAPIHYASSEVLSAAASSPPDDFYMNVRVPAERPTRAGQQSQQSRQTGPQQSRAATRTAAGLLGNKFPSQTAL